MVRHVPALQSRQSWPNIRRGGVARLEVLEPRVSQAGVGVVISGVLRPRVKYPGVVPSPGVHWGHWPTTGIISGVQRDISRNLTGVQGSLVLREFLLCFYEQAVQLVPRNVDWHLKLYL